MRLIDADELSKFKFHPLPYTHIVPNGENAESYERGWNDAIDAIISDAPSIDAVLAVRCKNCTYWLDAEVNEKGFFICPASGMEITEDDFCSYGEKVME